MRTTDLTPDRPENPPKRVRCPQCGGPSVYAPSNPYRPFCGERCKGMDLGAWASEHFRLPEQEPTNPPDFTRS